MSDAVSVTTAPTVSVDGCCMSGVRLDKRTYLPGVVVRSSCPKCSAPYVLDLGDHYLSYPEVGDPYALTACCDACEHEWPLCSIVVRMTVEIVS